MMDLYFRFPNQNDAETVLSEFRQDGEWITASNTHAIAVIGVIYKYELAGKNDELDPTPIPIPIPGYHINMLVWGPNEIDYLNVAPFYRIDTLAKPYGVWA